VTGSAVTDLPHLPAIPGLHARTLDRPRDYAALVAVDNAAFAHDGVEERSSLAGMASWLDHDEHLDPDRDVIIVEVSGAPVAYTLGGWEDDNDGGRNYWVWGQVMPGWRRRGLGSSLLAWTEQRLVGVADAQAVRGPRRFEAWCDNGDTSRRAVLEAAGYAPVRGWYEMTRPTLDDLPDVRLPEGVELRPAREEQLRTIWRANTEAFRDHFGGIDDSEGNFEQLRDNPLLDLSLWVVAWHGDEVVGNALNRIDPELNEALGVRHGRVNAVSVQRAWRRKGIGRAVVLESLRRLREAGMQGATLGVDEENPHGAVALYESLGFAVTRGGRIYRKALPLPEPVSRG
jgi:mycothiol synthase